jgi:large subunit ribosomal protein L7/L12
MATDTSKVLETLGGMTVLELVELKNKIEEEWGITAAAPVAVAAPGAAPAAGGDGAAAEEELERIEEERTQQAEQEMAIQERNALIGAAQPQENEKAPGKDSLYQMQQERGERGPANDR